MEVFIAEQSKAFIFIAMLGVAFGFLYDAMQFVRLLFRKGRIVTCITDLLFCIACALTFFIFTLTFMRGQVRGFGIIGCTLGMILYFLGISPYVMKIITPFAYALTNTPKRICSFFKKLTCSRLKK